MFTVIKTNKRSQTYKFETFAELQSWAEKNRYTQGFVTLRDKNDNEVTTVSNCYDLNSWCTGISLAMKGL